VLIVVAFSLAGAGLILWEKGLLVL